MKWFGLSAFVYSNINCFGSRGPWWPSSLECQSIMARMDLGFRGSNPAAACLDLFSSSGKTNFFREALRATHMEMNFFGRHQCSREQRPISNIVGSVGIWTKIIRKDEMKRNGFKNTKGDAKAKSKNDIYEHVLMRKNNKIKMHPWQDANLKKLLWFKLFYRFYYRIFLLCETTIL